MIELLSYPFMQRALLASLFAGVTCGIVGVWVVLLNIPFVGVAMSHSAFAGAVIGLLVGVNPLLSAVLFSLVAAALIGPVADRGDFSPNISISLIFSFVLGLAFLGIGLMKGPRTEALNFMWGNILTVGWREIMFLGATTAVIGIYLKLFFKETMAVLFSREVARAAGIAEKPVLYALLFMCGITVTLNLTTVGGLLIFSLITASPLAAAQMTSRLKMMYALSSLFSVLSCVGGLAASYALEVPSGAAIVMVSSSIFIIATVVSPKRRFNGGSAEIL